MTRTDDAVSIEAHALGVAASCPMCLMYEIREQRNRDVIEMQEDQFRVQSAKLAKALLWESAFWFALFLVVLMAATLAVKR